MCTDKNLDKEKVTVPDGLFKVLEVEIRRVPRRKTLSQVDRVGLDRERSHNSPDGWLVESQKSLSTFDSRFHIQ